MKVRLFVDGASRGNPGPAGLGAVIQDARGKTLAELSEALGETTNNVAEYRALLRGLAEARALGADEVEVFADSDLLVRQVTGAYRVKSAHLLPLYQEVQTVLAGFRRWRISHVPREENAAADTLANQAIDAAARDRVVELTALTLPTARGWRAWVPALPGCEVTAVTETAALARVRRLAAAHMAKGSPAGPRPPLPREHRLRFSVEKASRETTGAEPGQGD
ncbi:MAG: ribonuclease HI family protein [Armatimonadota bacterium]|nr:ribonuclease HI family protein [Armatimonadota bacterium]MDR7534053.1 ribonuclease HI family protein [Armatimonadota bacterium]MDR7537483.1 ribonuclease HI family protein [Armatimonadota bacterium]